VALMLSVMTWQASLPAAYRLYLPPELAQDQPRRKKAGVPEAGKFQSNPQIALDEICQVVAADLPRGAVLTDASYRINIRSREAWNERGLPYFLGRTSARWPGERRLPVKAGRLAELLRRTPEHRPVSLRESVVEIRRTACAG
jgi:SRSO17 transposase